MSLRTREADPRSRTRRVFVPARSPWAAVGAVLVARSLDSYHLLYFEMIYSRGL